VTNRSYARFDRDETSEIDVTNKLGTRLSAADSDLFRRYDDAFKLAVYWPDVENFRNCVKAYDAMIAGGTDGAH
jgi:predicted nucleotidyltransferase